MKEAAFIAARALKASCTLMSLLEPSRAPKQICASFEEWFPKYGRKILHAELEESEVAQEDAREDSSDSDDPEEETPAKSPGTLSDAADKEFPVATPGLKWESSVAF